MRVALLSDVHANLPALEAVLAHLDAEVAPDATYHLGDLVGYAPWPDEVVELLFARGVAGVAGNYDSTVAFDHGHCGCRYEDPAQEAAGHASYEWTRARISSGTKGRLASLPFRLDVRPLGGHAGGPTLVLLHGNAVLNTFYWTEDRDDAFCRGMAERVRARAGDLVAFGHTHLPWQREVDGVRFVNTGSVGRPKDGDPRACCVVVDVDADGGVEARLERVAYDVERAARAVEEAGLPRAFAEVLRTGGRRS